LPESIAIHLPPQVHDQIAALPGQVVGALKGVAE
jgi:hypothetical protein